MLCLFLGLAKIFEVRCFHFHLVENCQAGPDRVKRVKQLLASMQAQVYELLEVVKLSSALGPFLAQLRKIRKHGAGPTVGMQALRRLEEAGVREVKEMSALFIEHFCALGIRRNLAKQLWHAARRLRV